MIILMTLYASLVLCLAIVFLGGTLYRYLQDFRSRPVWVHEIRRLRQEGLVVNQDGEE